MMWTVEPQVGDESRAAPSRAPRRRVPCRAGDYVRRGERVDAAGAGASSHRLGSARVGRVSGSVVVVSVWERGAPSATSRTESVERRPRGARVPVGRRCRRRSDDGASANDGGAGGTSGWLRLGGCVLRSGDGHGRFFLLVRRGRRVKTGRRPRRGVWVAVGLRRARRRGRPRRRRPRSPRRARCLRASRPARRAGRRRPAWPPPRSWAPWACAAPRRPPCPRPCAWARAPT
mmetsp:Transcript_5952/g.24920  ORF Transcript_5952/g.24920 Transcript_5952/m.24920 type:complete len:232 (+) Transcript_5952:605-1300(+)